MTDSDSQLVDELEYDPFFLHARREAVIIFCCWFVAMLWAVPYCYYYGYGIADPEKISTTFGIPSWLLWGIGMPWLLADIFTTWFCFWFMKDGELGSAGDENLPPVAEAGEEATS